MRKFDFTADHIKLMGSSMLLDMLSTGPDWSESRLVEIIHLILTGRSEPYEHLSSHEKLRYMELYREVNQAVVAGRALGSFELSDLSEVGGRLAA
jgi:hypothetical protein